jgi:hypothetical protein
MRKVLEESLLTFMQNFYMFNINEIDSANHFVIQ